MAPHIDPAAIVFINLTDRVDRLAAFRRHNAHLGAVRRFSAVEGRDLDRTALQARAIIAGGLDYSDHALGCAMSHFALWEEIAGGTRAVTVCEDDAVLAHDFIETGNARLGALPDGWDIVLWGWNFDSWLVFDVLPGQPAFLMHAKKPVTAETLAAAAQAPASAQLFRLYRACGTLCYTISPKGAAGLLGRCRPLQSLQVVMPEVRLSVPNRGIDLAMSAVYPQMIAYVSVPPLAISPNAKDGRDVGRTG
jgi:glycosyl transferase family 25